MTLDEIIEAIGVKPFYQEPAGVIYCADCLDILPRIPDNCIDLTWTDPPYNCGKDYGIYKDNLPDDEYIGWIANIFKQLDRIARARAVFTPRKYKPQYWNMLGHDYQEIILTYGPAGMKHKNGFANQFSSILTDAHPIRYCTNVWHNVQMTALGWFFTETTYGHPGYTSEDLSKRIITNLCSVPGIIIDPFGGTGSSSRAAKETGREYILIELNPEYCQIAVERLKQEVLAL